MANDFEEKFVKPIVNACMPGTLAALSLAVLQIKLEVALLLKVVLLTASFMFLLSAFAIFFYTIYPTRKKIWMLTAITFLMGLACSMLASILLFVWL